MRFLDRENKNEEDIVFSQLPPSDVNLENGTRQLLCNQRWRFVIKNLAPLNR